MQKNVLFSSVIRRLCYSVSAIVLGNRTFFLHKSILPMTDFYLFLPHPYSSYDQIFAKEQHTETVRHLFVGFGFILLFPVSGLSLGCVPLVGRLSVGGTAMTYRQQQHGYAYLFTQQRHRVPKEVLPLPLSSRKHSRAFPHACIASPSLCLI